MKISSDIIWLIYVNSDDNEKIDILNMSRYILNHIINDHYHNEDIYVIAKLYYTSIKSNNNVYAKILEKNIIKRYQLNIKEVNEIKNIIKKNISTKHKNYSYNFSFFATIGEVMNAYSIINNTQYKIDLTYVSKYIFFIASKYGHYKLLKMLLKNYQYTLNKYINLYTLNPILTINTIYSEINILYKTLNKTMSHAINFKHIRCARLIYKYINLTEKSSNKFIF